MDKRNHLVLQKGISLVAWLAASSLLFAIAVVWASASHFGECKKIDAETLLSTCKSTLPKAGFGKVDAAPKFKSSIDLSDLPTRLTRVSDNDYFETDNGGAVHSYSRRQAWNADESLVAIGGKILLADRLDFLVEELPVSSEHVWSNSDPDIIFGFRFIDKVLNQFVSFNARSLEIVEIIKLDGLNACSIGRGEGSQSNDDQFVVFVCGEEDGSAEIISFDIKQKKILGQIEIQEYVNWASVSQSGKYVVVESSIEQDTPRRLTRFSIDLVDSELLSNERHHGDLGVDENGDDVFVMLGDNFISYIRLKDARKTQMPISGYARKAGHGHVSCRNIKRPGWCYISTYNNLVGAVKIAESDNILGFGLPVSGAVRGVAVFEHWGYHESSSEQYASTPRASASPSGKQIILSSDWGANEQTNAYVLSLQDEAPASIQ